MDTINLTTNLKLGKPNIDEKYDVQVQNMNMDLIDSSIKKLQDADHNFATSENLQEHTGNRNNPHGVTKQQIGLDKVVNRQQIYGIPGVVTAGGIPVFDGSGYTVRDSGFTIGKSVPPNAVFTDTTYGIADENVPGIIKSSDSIQVSSDGTASVVDESHSHDTQYYTKSDSLKLNNEFLTESKNYTDLKIAEHTADSIIQRQIVDRLPTSNINTNIIYLVPKANASSGSNDNYNEYINLNGETTGWEFIGNTYIDLADYYNKSETNRIFLLNSNISQNNENEINKVPSSALLHYVLQEKDSQIQNLQNEINEINSNLSPKSGTISFLDLTKESSNKGYGGNLDKLHSSISSYANQSNQMIWVGNGGNMYALTLHKYSNNYYCGTIQTYIPDVVHCFSYNNGHYAFR